MCRAPTRREGAGRPPRETSPASTWSLPAPPRGAGFGRSRRGAPRDSTPSCRPPPLEKTSHVGDHLIDRGRGDLEAELASGPSAATRARRLLLRHAANLYLAAIAIATGLLLAAAIGYARSCGATPLQQLVAALFVLLPASDF